MAKVNNSNSSNSNKSDKGADAFLRAAKGLGKAWQDARKNQNSSFSNDVPDMEDGTYWLQLESSSCGVKEIAVKSQKGTKVLVPWVRFGMVVRDGEYEGTKVAKFANLSNPNAKDEDKSLEYFAKFIHGMGYDAEEIGNNPATFGQELTDLCAQLSSEKPNFLAYIKTTEYVGQNGPVPQMSIYSNEPLDEEGNKLEELEGGDDDEDEDDQGQDGDGEDPEPEPAPTRKAGNKKPAPKPIKKSSKKSAKK